MSASTALKILLSEQTCTACASNISVGTPQLCSECEKYAIQDYVYRREVPLPDHALQSIMAQKNVEKPIVVQMVCPDSFKNLLSQGKLSPRQKEIFQLRFVENLNFFDISKKLQISNASVFIYYRRGLKRLKKCLINVPLVREQDSKSNPPAGITPQKKAQALKKGPKLCPVRVFRLDTNGDLRLVQMIEPSQLTLAPPPKQVRSGNRKFKRDQYPKNCPRCSEVLLRPSNQAPFCAECLWVPELYD